MPSTITNKLGYPQEIVDAVSFDGYIKEGQYSPSDLFQPLQITVLKRNVHFEQDVHDMIPMLQGSAMHHVLEMAHYKDYELAIMQKALKILERMTYKNPELADKADTLRAMLEEFKDFYMPQGDDVLLEHSLKYELPNGFTISGRPDKIVKSEKRLVDLKNVSVSQAKTGGYTVERSKQLNFYRWLIWVVMGIKIEKMELLLFYKDYSKMKGLHNYSYPKKAVEAHSIAFSFPDEQLPSIVDNVQKLVEKVDGYVQRNELIECTPADKWQSDSMFAVMKKGNKQATRIFDRKEAAEAFLGTLNAPPGMYSILERKGEPTRCLYYCSVRSVCPQRFRELGKYVDLSEE